MARLEASITADARGRVARHELKARAIRATHCHALGNGARGDELDLRKALGRYACEAGVVTASNAGITSTLGVPFVGTIDFARGRLTWCKDNPASASDVSRRWPSCASRASARRRAARCSARATSSSRAAEPSRACA